MTDVILVDLSQSDNLAPYGIHGGFRYLAAYSRAKGLNVKFLFLTNPSLSLNEVFLAYLKEIKKNKPLVLCFSPVDANFRIINAFVKKVKAWNIKSIIALGGHFATFNHKEILRDHKIFDIVVRGEGEETLFDLVGKIKKKQSLINVLGITYKKGGRIFINNWRPLIQNLDALPFPATDDIEEAQKQGYKVATARIYSSRGCYGNCSYCSIQKFYKAEASCNSWRARSPKNVVDEIELYYKKFGIRQFPFVDDNFMGPGRIGKERAVQIGKELLARGLKIKFWFACRANDVDEKTIRFLKKAGLKIVNLGIESGFQRALDTFNKKITVKQNDRALKILVKNKIKITAGFIFFDPYMTPKELFINASYFEKLQKVPGLFNIMVFPFFPLTPFSGTALLEKLRNEELLKGNYKKGYSAKFRDKRIKELYSLSSSILKPVTQVQKSISMGKLTIVKEKRIRAALSQVCPLFLKVLKEAGKTLSKSDKISVKDFLSSQKPSIILKKITTIIEKCRQQYH